MSSVSVSSSRNASRALDYIISAEDNLDALADQLAEQFPPLTHGQIQALDHLLK